MAGNCRSSILIKLEYGVLEGGKLGYLEKNPQSKARTNTKFKPQMTKFTENTAK